MRTTMTVAGGLLCLALIVPAGPAQSETKMKVSGVHAHHTESETYELADGRKILVLNGKGMSLPGNPDDPMYAASQDCFGAYILSADGSDARGRGACVILNANADGYWVDWEGDFAGGTWTYVHGVGAYEGISGGGTWTFLNNAVPAGRSYDRWEGEMILP